jgi:outer membrane protein assembly factor BamB
MVRLVVLSAVVLSLVAVADASNVSSVWTFKTGGRVWSGPAVSADGGTIFVGSNDYNLYALSATTGEQKWDFKTGMAVESSPAVGEDGTVYVPSWDGYVYAVEGATGELVWKFATDYAGHQGDDTSPTSIGSKPQLGPDGTVYVTTPVAENETVYALNGTTGALLWTTFAGQATSSPTLSADGATLFLGNNEGRFFALDSATGKIKWTKLVKGNGMKQWGVPAIGADGTVYAPNCNGNLYSLDGATGHENWFLTPRDGGCMRSKPSIANDGTIFIGTEVGVTAVEAGDQASIKWNSAIGTFQYAGLTLGADGATLYAATAYDQTGSGSVHALDIQNGEVKWTFNPPECSADQSLRCYFTESTPAVGADGTIFVGSDDTYVYALPA